MFRVIDSMSVDRENQISGLLYEYHLLYQFSHPYIFFLLFFSHYGGRTQIGHIWDS
uniref:Uncharacterized protein n=1 Tax=Solanum lycopersicum TaxID=4081 RepID=A0A3Q7IAD3_SOLLC